MCFPNFYEIYMYRMYLYYPLKEFVQQQVSIKLLALVSQGRERVKGKVYIHITAVMSA